MQPKLHFELNLPVKCNLGCMLGSYSCVNNPVFGAHIYFFKYVDIYASQIADNYPQKLNSFFLFKMFVNFHSVELNLYKQ
jgi:hypothetical protein